MSSAVLTLSMMIVSTAATPSTLVEAIEGTAPALPELATHGDWLLACSSAGADKPRCQLQPISQVGEGPASISLVIIVSEPDRPVIVLRTPLEILLPEGVDLVVDGVNVGRLAFQICDSAGCVAPVPFDGEVGARLRRGLSLVARVRSRDGTLSRATYSLRGLNAGLSALREAPR